MSETCSTFLNGRAGYLLVAGAFVFLLIVVVVRFLSSAPAIPVSVNESAVQSVPRRVGRTAPAVFDAESFYRTIIDNNLFRPLGWTPPRRVEPYRLIGTLLPRSAHTPPKAIIESTTGEKTYIVSVGEKIDALTEVVLIESKAVTLSSNGEQRTLRLNTTVYLNPSPARRPPRRTPHTPTPAPVRSIATPAPSTVSAPPTETHRPAPLSDWETREGERIRFGDARLKNPEKWGLRRR